MSSIESGRQVSRAHAAMVGIGYRPEHSLAQYETVWDREEDAREFHIGCADLRDRQALVLLVEAARLLCAVDRVRAMKLATLALEDIAGRIKSPRSAYTDEEAARIWDAYAVDPAEGARVLNETVDAHLAESEA